MQYQKKVRNPVRIYVMMLPDVDGFALCQSIRKEWYFPIIMLTAKIQDVDKITGLTMGADDYITKPFKLLKDEPEISGQLRQNTNPWPQQPETEWEKLGTAAAYVPDKKSLELFRLKTRYGF